MSDLAAERTDSWRSRAVSRSAEPARVAAEERVQRFLDAALELLNSPSGDDFTVQNVCDRAGMSLRKFYVHFAGKHELMLALFEESIRTTAAHLQRLVDDLDDPVARIRTFTTEYYRMCRSGDPRDTEHRLPSRSVGNFAHQLLYDHPEEASQAFTPLVALLQRIMREAAAAGAIRSDLDDAQLAEVAGIVLQAIMFNAFATTITGASSDGSPERGALLWELLLGGLQGAPDGAS